MLCKWKVNLVSEEHVMKGACFVGSEVLIPFVRM